MSERLMLEGKLSGLEHEVYGLRLKIDGLCKSIRTGINPSLYEIEEMNIAQAAQQMDELVMAQAELLGALAKIGRLKRELGRG